MTELVFMLVTAAFFALMVSCTLGFSIRHFSRLDKENNK